MTLFAGSIHKWRLETSGPGEVGRSVRMGDFYANR
jgi:hypothetical protein